VSQQPSQPMQPFDRLSAREFQVAALVALALTDQQIAKSLFITVSTVKAHIASIK
jgi:DNA-binding NarL/FixJ family response regulator